ncbi:nucleoside-diphosphate sugar epimerase/dehydratase, partial [Rhizobium johnstonii]|uniref:nucleoside-diphosphate sugar epimerase/dehydratase n=1 Tax=Rhizobium johnstonii TaxID=3019933 RepID=UPI003F9BCBA9
MLIAFPLGMVALLAERWLWRQWLLRKRGEGHYLSRALVVGRGRCVSEPADDGHLLADFAPAGVVDDGA